MSTEAFFTGTETEPPVTVSLRSIGTATDRLYYHGRAPGTLEAHLLEVPGERGSPQSCGGRAPARRRFIRISFRLKAQP